MAIVGVAKFLGCEKTLVKNPSEAVGPYETSDGRQCADFFFFFFREILGVFVLHLYYYGYK